IKRELLTLAPSADPERIIVKPNGIDAQCFPIIERAEPYPDAAYRLVTVCRIEPKKGLLDLVEAVHLLRQRGRNVEAHVIGAVDEWSEASRDYKRQLDQRISDRDLWGKVHLEGRHGSEGVRQFLTIAQLFVAPFVETATGDKDGIPTAVLEGMATGLPVVATDAGSIPEVITDGVEGLLVPQRNAAALADAIEALLTDPARRQACGQAASQTVHEKFDVRTCEAAFHDRLHAVLDSRRPV
ncbi:MAG: glycosyltransferase, partial [Planctomycetaceae bacterium]|nr:glycosyltransferase [Planctomycetaceae bacterium]